MYILILIAMAGAQGISVHHIKFNSEQACLQAINAVIDMEKYSTTIKAKCVKE